MFFIKNVFIVVWQDAEHKAAFDQGFQLEAEKPVESLPEQKSEAALLEFNDEFVPGTVCK